MSDEVIKELLMNLTDRIVQLQDQFAVVKEIIGDLYEKNGLVIDRLHIIEKVQPPDIKMKIEKERGFLFNIKSKIGSTIEGRKVNKDERNRRKEREKKLQKEKELKEAWL